MKGDPVFRKGHRLWPVAFLLFLLLAGCAIGTPTSTTDSSANDGLPVAPEFQGFYRQNGGLRVFGFPITEAYPDADSGRLVQYFQRLRLEYDPGEDEVLVTPLGQWAVAAQPGIIYVDPESPSGTAGDEIKVEDAFLTFYQAHGGETLLGQPLTGQLEAGGMRSQYFQNGRLDWVPEAPLDLRVQLALLGEAHYRQVGIFDDPERSRPMDSAGIREAGVSASVWAPILYAGEEQTVYVEVRTPESRRPVTGVSVKLTAHYNGANHTFTLPETDGTGHTHESLALKDLQPGQEVRLVVQAISPGGAVIGTTTKSFKSWW